MARQKNGNDSVNLRVDEAMQRDVGKKRARISQDAMLKAGIRQGDVILISGARQSCATAWPADEDDDKKSPHAIRIDGQTRNNAGIALGEAASVSLAESQEARSVSLVPVGRGEAAGRKGGGRSHDAAARVGGGGGGGGNSGTGNHEAGAGTGGAAAEAAAGADKDFVDFVRGKLSGLPVTDGDEISVMILGSPRMFRVSGTQPRGIVRVADGTAVAILPVGSEPLARTKVTYEEVGGLLKEVRAMREIVELPLRHPELFAMLGVEPHSGILLYGPPGCGKTLIAKVLASESEARMFLINGPEIMTKYYGDTEARLRDIFKEAKDSSPSIVFIDEIDAISPKREDVRGDVEKRVVAQLLALMDGLNDRGNVMVLGATNRPDSIDPALRRPGRFDREFEISVPNEDGRYEILLIHTRGMPLAGDIDVKAMASELHGYTGADIKSLCREAALRSIRRYLPEIDLESDTIPTEVLHSMTITLADFYDAMREVVPTAMREFYVESPNTRLQDVGGLEDIKESLADNIISAIRDPAKFARMGVKPPRGALIYGPPGCGKSMLGRALARETGANMIRVRGPEILSKWVGESEKAVREIFRKANAAAPCVVILDELDAIARARPTAGEGDGVGGAGGGATILSQLLTEIEDASPRVAVIGITNRPDMLDRSLLRAGRLDLMLYASPPDQKGRLEIMGALTSRMPLAGDVSLEKIAAATQNYTGSDLAALCRESAISAIKAGSDTVSHGDFESALGRVSPSFTQDTQQWYDRVRQDISNVVPPPASDKTTVYG